MNQRRFQHVAVLKGGPSAERDVSLRSGAAITAGLRRRGYRVSEVDVTAEAVDVPADADAAFIALHGTFGEDGGLQEILQARGLPFTGSGAAASRRAFDKVVSKRVFEQAGIPTPRCQVMRRGDARQLPLPVVVKPPRQGSSIGLSKVFEEGEWAPALDLALSMGDEALVEVFIEGRELTVGIVGDQVLPVVEIRAPGGCYDYRAKYTAGLTEYLVPAPLPPEATRLCQELAWRTHQALGCRGLGRVDIRLAGDGAAFVLEMNTIPGFTETSLLPKAAKCAGLDFPDLCERILNLAEAAP